MATGSQSEFDKAFQEMEEDFSYSKKARRELIENLRDQACKIKFSEYDKASVTLAKVAIVNAFDGLLKSDENLSLQKIKMKLARKDSETNGLVGQTIAAMLKSIRVNEMSDTGASKTDPTEGAMEAITQRAEELVKTGDKKTIKALTVSDGETTECGGASPTTSVPVSKLKPLKQDDSEEE